MKRREFIQKSMFMGIGAPLLSSLFLESCAKNESIFPQFQTDFSGKIIIVGAGAAGLAAGYLLRRYNIDFEILEAAPVYGGRIKKAEGFADFPIDLGAEWIHTHPSILSDILNQPDAHADMEIVVYNPQTIQSWKNDRLHSYHFMNNLYNEWKFKNGTWFDFFDRHIVPDIADKIRLNQAVRQIDCSGSGVSLTTSDNETFYADKVLITAPLKTLQNQQIQFIPDLPSEKMQAINRVSMGDGIKIFVEFKERFYPDILAFGDFFEVLNKEDKFVYDAAFGKDSSKHVLALFAVNEKATAYTQLGDDASIISAFLAELDVIFEGKASPNYLKHLIQNWSKEPYIQGAYSYTFEGNRKNIVRAIEAPVEGRLYFAGEALSLKNGQTVHGACESAYATAAKMLTN